MSLVGRVGRKRFRARFALLVVYSVLAVGAVTTIYPFAVMASTGFKGPTDQNDNVLVPTYWNKVDGKDEKTGATDDKALYGKYLADKYAADAAMIASTRTGEPEFLSAVSKYEEFLSLLPVDYWSAGFKIGASQVTSRLAKRYRDWLQAKYGTIDALNKAYIEENVGFQTVVPPVELLEKPNWKQPATRKYKEWRDFKNTLPIEFRIPVRETRMFQEFLRTKYQNQFAQIPTEEVGSATKFEELRLPEPPPARFRFTVGPTNIEEFLDKSLPDRYAGGAAEYLWTKFLEDGKDGPPMALPVPGALARISLGRMPIESFERKWVTDHQSEIRTEFATRNYAYVAQYIALNGRALWNTVIFCLLAIVTQLTVNPLAAYALSRYPIRASGKILIFLLATMAFPAEVAMIPGFLLLKQTHLLNTFAALVLPTAASGYMIFLLKGFFDSLPQELFEAGQIDGAKESTMMTRIALPLSRPVFGYLALIAFMGAYGAFLYAFLVVQDQKMWTLMVWIYQLQSTAPKAVVMAALTLAAIPTLLVFLIAQRTIMKGIVLPSER
jgi:multiple sugar transport system permease protein